MEEGSVASFSFWWKMDKWYKVNGLTSFELATLPAELQKKFSAFFFGSKPEKIIKNKFSWGQLKFRHGNKSSRELLLNCHGNQRYHSLHVDVEMFLCIFNFLHRIHSERNNEKSQKYITVIE